MEQVLLPPWTKRKRLATLVTLTGFILLASGFIGYGLYTTGVRNGWVRKPFSKELVMEELMNDAGFVKAVKKSGSQILCENEQLKFGYYYLPPFKEVNSKGDCGRLVTLHSTGADVVVELKRVDESKEKLTTEVVKNFSYVEAMTLPGTKLPTTRVVGTIGGIDTEIYVIGVDRNQSFLVSYAPTDPTLTGKVIGLVESFYSIPQ